MTQAHSILIVDDDSDDVMMARKALKGAGFGGSIDVVSDGVELLAALDGTLPALILLDLNLPRKSGLEALLEIKANQRLRSIPIVIYTTSADRLDIDAAYAAGANSYVVKAISFSGTAEVFRIIATYWMKTVQLPLGEP